MALPSWGMVKNDLIWELSDRKIFPFPKSLKNDKFRIKSPMRVAKPPPDLFKEIL
jgi:hypothetical protein